MKINELRNKLTQYAEKVQKDSNNTNLLSQVVYDYVKYIIQKAVYVTVGVNNKLNQVSLSELQDDILIKVLSSEFINKIKTDRIKAYQHYIYITARNEVLDFINEAKNKQLLSKTGELSAFNISINNEPDPIYWLSASTATYVINYLTTYSNDNHIFKHNNSDSKDCYLKLINYVSTNDTTVGFVRYCRTNTDHNYQTVRQLIEKFKLNIKLF